MRLPYPTSGKLFVSSSLGTKSVPHHKEKELGNSGGSNIVAFTASSAQSRPIEVDIHD